MFEYAKRAQQFLPCLVTACTYVLYVCCVCTHVRTCMVSFLIHVYGSVYVFMAERFQYDM